MFERVRICVQIWKAPLAYRSRKAKATRKERWKRPKPEWPQMQSASKRICQRVLPEMKSHYHAVAFADILKFLPKKAVGEMMPVLLATTIAMPDSKKGVVKSTTVSRSALIFRADSTKSVLLLTNSHIRPFHEPCYATKKKSIFQYQTIFMLKTLTSKVPHLGSGTRTKS